MNHLELLGDQVSFGVGRYVLALLCQVKVQGVKS